MDCDGRYSRVSLFGNLNKLAISLPLGFKSRNEVVVLLS